MELNRNSLSARAYRDFYGTNVMPESLCPYFWALAFAWPIVIICAPLAWPFWLADRKRGYRMDVPTIGKAFFGIALGLCLYLVACLGVFISAAWITYYKPTLLYNMYCAGGVIAIAVPIIAAIFGTFYLIGIYKDKKRERDYQYMWDENGNYIPLEDRVYPKSNIIVEFIKASYKKYCPKIDWKN